MPDYAQTLTHLFATAMVVMQFLIVAALVYRVLRGSWVPLQLRPYILRWGLWVAAALPVASLVLSLWYSEVVGLPVCVLCWLGRTMMYPLAFMMPVAAWTRDTAVLKYVMPLTGLGMLVTGYQHLLQMGVVTGGACSVLSGAGDCAARYVFEYGYITMPLFGFTVFAAVLVLVRMVRDLRAEEDTMPQA